MNYDSWLKTVPVEVTGDTLWKVEAYRLAMFLTDLGWRDVTKLMHDKRTFGLADQLYRSCGSIGANISEGYSRGSGKDRVRFYEYSLGSARETRGWYFNARHSLGENVADHRTKLVAQIIRLLLTMIPEQRDVHLREEEIPYRTQSDASSNETTSLLIDVPMPVFTHHVSRIKQPDNAT